MGRLEFRTLTKDADIDAFLECFKHYVNVKLPATYAKNGDVVGAFKDGEMIGGYMLITRGPFRSLAFVPDEIKHNIDAIKNSSSTDFVEVNGFWVKEAYRRSTESLQLWFQLRKHILSTKASHMLIFYNAQAKGLAGIYEETLKPERIYQGAPAANPTATTAHAQITVGMVSRWNMRLSIYRGLSRILNRKRLAWVTSSAAHVGLESPR